MLKQLLFFALLLMTPLAASTTALAQTVNLSAISGVTVYSTEAAALAGAVDSGSAITTYIQAQSPSSAAPLTINWDGWVYVSDVLQYCASGGNTINQINPSATSAGAVFAKTANSKPKMWNANRVSYYAGIIDQNVTLSGLTFDFNYATGDAQQTSDTTWGYSTGALFAGVKNIKIINCTLLNPKSYSCQFAACDTVQTIGNLVDVGTTPKATVNFDGWHYSGPCQYIYSNGDTLRTWDDAFALNAQEVPQSIASTNTVNFYKAPWFQGAAAGGSQWNGGPISHVYIVNPVFKDAYHGVRLLNHDPSAAIIDVVLDGATGSIAGPILFADTLISSANNGSYVATSSNVTLRNASIRPFQVFANEEGESARCFGRYASCTNWTIDLATCQPINSDFFQGTPISFLKFDLNTTRTGLSMGLASTPLYTDTFARANAAAGGVGNSWLDTATAFGITSNLLTIPNQSSSNSNLARTYPSSQIGDMEATMDYKLADFGSEVASLQMNHAPLGATTSDTSYSEVFRAGTSAGTQQQQMTRKIAGASTTLNSYTFTASVGDTMRVREGHYLQWVYGDVTDLTSGALPYSFDLYGDPLISSASTTDYNLSGRWPNAGGAWQVSGTAATTLIPLILRGLTVTATTPSVGAATCSVSSLPAGAAATAGTWNLSGPALGNAQIDPWGRITGLSSPLTAPVTATYTADGFKASVILTTDGTTPITSTLAGVTSTVSRASGEIAR